MLFATTFFRGKTEDWIKPKIKKYFKNLINTDIKDFFENWNIFKKKFTRVFGIANKKKLLKGVFKNFAKANRRQNIPLNFNNRRTVLNRKEFLYNIYIKRDSKKILRINL